MCIKHGTSLLRCNRITGGVGTVCLFGVLSWLAAKHAIQLRWIDLIFSRGKNCWLLVRSRVEKVMHLKCYHCWVFQFDLSNPRSTFHSPSPLFLEVFGLPVGATPQCLRCGAGCGQCGYPSRKIRGKEVELTCLSLHQSSWYSIWWLHWYICCMYSLYIYTHRFEVKLRHFDFNNFSETFTTKRISGSEEPPFDWQLWSVPIPASPWIGDTELLHLS